MPRRACYIKLPYSSPNCEPFGEKLKKLVEKTYSSVNLRIAFTAPSDLSKNFKFKDKIIKVEKPCRAGYIGKTERISSYRIKENQSQRDTAYRQEKAKFKHSNKFTN